MKRKSEPLYCNLNVCARSGCPHVKLLQLQLSGMNVDTGDGEILTTKQYETPEIDSGLCTTDGEHIFPGEGITSLSLQVVSRAIDTSGHTPSGNTVIQQAQTLHMKGVTINAQTNNMVFCFHDEHMQWTVPKGCPYYMEMVVLGNTTVGTKRTRRSPKHEGTESPDRGTGPGRRRSPGRK
jgi:hypothetical protein